MVHGLSGGAGVRRARLGAGDAPPAAVASGTDRVCAQRVLDVFSHMRHLRHGLDAAGIGTVELLEVLQDTVQVDPQFRHFHIRECEVRQRGDVAYFLFGDFHASALFRAAL